MNYSVCVDAFYTGKDFFAGIEELCKLDMKTIEFWSWWDKDLAELISKQKQHGISVNAFCTKLISLTDKSCHQAYLQGLEESIAVAHRLGCKQLITQVGQDTGAPRAEQLQNIVDGITMCLPLLEENKITLLVEPLNVVRDHKGYFLSKSEEAFGLIKTLNSTHVKVLFDIYHQQLTEGNILIHMLENLSDIGHIHAAGITARHELDEGEINYSYLFDVLHQEGYTGLFGLEYFPTKDIGETIKQLLKRSD